MSALAACCGCVWFLGFYPVLPQNVGPRGGVAASELGGGGAPCPAGAGAGWQWLRGAKPRGLYTTWDRTVRFCYKSWPGARTERLRVAGRVGSNAAVVPCSSWKLPCGVAQLCAHGLGTNWRFFSPFITIFEWHCMLFTPLAILKFFARCC